MKKGHRLILGLGFIGVAILSGVLFQIRSSDNILEFSIQDKVCGSWVWNANITFQDRVIQSFYQGDAGIKTLRFTDLKTGEWKLTISAPLYKPETIIVNIKKGFNSLIDPIELTGLSFSDLHHFVVFETINNNEIVSELRPVNSKGESSLKHPCLDIRIFTMVSEQMKDGLFARNSESADSYRGNLIFAGEIDWSWDSGFDTIFRYSAHIPGSELSDSKAAFLIIDYLIIIPDPEQMDSDNMDELSLKLSETSEIEAMIELLDSFGTKIRYFLTTSWNVEWGVL